MMIKTNLLKSITIGCALFFGVNYSFAQCPGGQVEVTIDVNTDNWGSEVYWELVPTGNACGVGVIFAGGNAAVGCGGGGIQANPAGGYGNNQTYSEGPWCLTDGACYDIIFVDDYGDGGGDFDVMVSGFNIGNYTSGSVSNQTFTFCATVPPAYDAGVWTVASPYLYDDQGLKDVKGNLYNYGTTTITSLDISYKVDNNATQTMPLTGLNIPNATGYDFIHPTQWNASLGTHTIKVWTSNLNGNSDMDASNDTVTRVVEIGPGIPNIIDDYVGVTPIITQIGNSSDQLDKPTDLDFHPALSRKELWVINKRTEGAGGSVVIYDNAGEPTQTDQQKVDGNAWHFMSLPTGMAFSKNGNWANSPGVYDANHNGGAPFTGPGLWSSDLLIFAQPSGGNGSHLDMLHESPYSQGIASEKDNVFWLFDGNSSDIVRYDFVNDHGPGNTYHDDAIVHRYSDFTVAKDPNDKVSSHLAIDNGWVYVVDYGNQKVFRIEMGTGTIGGTPSATQYETLADYKNVSGYTTDDVVTSGLVEPSGIDVIGNRMIVSDYSTGDVIIYDITNMPAVELGRIATGATGIMGIKIGPDGKIWYVDYDANTVNRIDGSGVSIGELALDNALSVYPNPAKNNFSINLKGVLNDDIDINVYDVTGKLVYNTVMNDNTVVVNTENWVNGIYQVHLSNDTNFSTEKIVVQH